MHRFLARGAVVRRGLAAALVLALPLAATACGQGSDSPAGASGGGVTAVKVGVIPIIDVAPIYLGIKQGFFKAKGLDVTLETAQGGAAIVPSVVSGQFQFGFSNTVSLLLAGSQGLPLKVVSSGVASTGQQGKDFGAVIVPGGSDIKTAADLAGKKVAVNTLKNINTTTIDSVVRQAGGDPSKIQYVELPFPDIAPAVARGDVAAGQLVEPFLTIATQQGNRQVVSNYAGTDPNLAIALYFTSRQYAEKNPTVVKEFTDAMATSLAYAQEHPDQARQILDSYTKIDPKVRDAVVLPKWPAAIDKDSVRKLADLARQSGLLTKTPDIDALFP
jgi:NitT/TauT family transport system substrate-binding protein